MSSRMFPIKTLANVLSLGISGYGSFDLETISQAWPSTVTVILTRPRTWVCPNWVAPQTTFFWDSTPSGKVRAFLPSFRVSLS